MTRLRPHAGTRPAARASGTAPDETRGPAPSARQRPTAQAPGFLLALLGALALLGGCVSEPQRLALRDNSSRDADVVVTVRPEAWSRRSGGPARGFEAGYQRYRAEGPQTLATGESIIVRGTPIPGPDTLDQKATIATWHLGFTDRFYFGPAFELDVGVGGMKMEMSYELVPRSGAVGAQPFAREVTLPYGAITPRWRFGPHVALESRLTAAGLTDDAEHRHYDVGLLLSPVPQLTLRLGYSQRRARLDAYADPVFSSVEVVTRSRGPSLGLRVDF